MIPLARHAVVALAFLVAGCQSLYFQEAEPAAPHTPPRSLVEWPDRDYWWGLVFNGNRIGFSHLSLAPAAGAPGLFELRSESALLLRFMGFEKRIALKAVDVVRADLEMVRFRYDYAIDGSEIALAGERSGDILEVSIRRANETTRQTLTPGGPVYPQSAMTLYPALHGLASDRTYRFRVYSGELMKVAEVTQRIGAYERSTLFEGAAFRMETELEGYRVQSWVNPRGQAMLEIAMNGVLISGLESERRARSYLVEASFNRSEALLEFALVRTQAPLRSPRQAKAMRIALSGADRAVPSDDLQRCARTGAETVCEIGADAAKAADGAEARFLASTFTIPARHPTIVATARQIAGNATDARTQIQRLLAWIDANIRKSPADVFSALDVLDKREAECQGHALLYAALARALGIPTRVANGIVYSDDHQGFLYHAWAESLVDDRWVAVDPTFAAVPADATHVKLVEGESLAELAPLADWIGKLQVRVLATEY